MDERESHSLWNYLIHSMKAGKANHPSGTPRAVLDFARDSRRALTRSSKAARKRFRVSLRRSSPFDRRLRDPFPIPAYSWGSLLLRWEDHTTR